ncbi:MAG: Vi polysaccharide biosynthesis UDP-N-acetylglucosamine C-6 dehydrogenase TviB [Gammaproteobacteria bacterium]|nr:Vi polysaccharide biosynthesis UDP-N-acetylglucosamine C-6 dehydrogenase TviB [Gammaproteobacteria bacterium]
MNDSTIPHIAVIGLGYVGLPLAIEFGKVRKTIGFDINLDRVCELIGGIDKTQEVSSEELTSSVGLSFTSDITALSDCNIYIVTVPTPIDGHKNPNLLPLISASRALGKVLAKGDIVIYESTVYPGATEEVCVPELEAISGLKFNEDFFAGYSPERINPGDKTHRLPSIVKVTSGSTPEISDRVDALYQEIITAGTHQASSIRVAEAAKVIENTQRDLNIALINELSKIFAIMGLDTQEVLEAAGTKWNFLPFRPGLVGGHCISVDPYYLTHKAQAVGYQPEVILAGRRINDSMGSYVAERVTKLMTRKRIHIVDSKILILGLAFKENCPDLRNTRVIDIHKELIDYHASVDIYDPWVDAKDALNIYGVHLAERLEENKYDAVIVAVGHQQFKAMDIFELKKYCKEEHVIFDIKHVFPKESVDGRL